MMLGRWLRTGSLAALTTLVALTSGCRNAPLAYETIWDSAQYGAVADIDVHLRQGVAVNARNGQGQTPLMLAAGAGQLPAVKALIKRGAGVSVTDAGGQTAAFKAATGGHLEVVEYLLDKGADWRARDVQHRTLLHIAAAGGDTDLMALLVSRGANMAQVASVAPSVGPTASPAPPNSLVPEPSPATQGATPPPAATGAAQPSGPPDRARPATSPEFTAPSQPRSGPRPTSTGRTPTAPETMQAACESNLKLLCLALMMYAQDYDEVLPLPSGISAAVYPYCRNDALWYCPAWRADRPGYALSRLVPGKQLAAFPSPAGQFSFFEADLGKEPLVGGAGDLARPPRHQGGSVFGFVDGHCRWYKAGEEPKNGWE